MAPAAKRRKRVVDSDDEERPQSNITRFFTPSPAKKNSGGSRAPTASPSPLKKSTRAVNNNADAASPGTSPEKPRTRARAQKKVKIEEKGKTADLLTLFSKQAQKSKASSAARSKPDALDEITSDPITDDDDVSYTKASSSSIVGEKAKKRLRNGAQVLSSSQAAPNPNQMFVRPPKPTRPETLDDDLRPWSERFGPVNLEELAVHKKKVADVRRWIEDVMEGRMRQRLLLLKGAAGTGKTTTVRLLARNMGFELLEWRNPTGGFVPGMLSHAAQFEAFLGQGGKFGSLDIEGSGAREVKQECGPKVASRRMILIEEFPNTFTRYSSALTSFRNAISGYLAENTPSLASFQHGENNNPVTPVIMVISETLLTTTSASADSFTAHRLLGPEIIRHPGTGVFEFNPIAPSLLAKALELVVVKEAKKSGRRRTPGPKVLKRLGEIGDIRNAVASLEFLCLKGDQDSDWGAKVSFTKQKKGVKDGIAMTRGEAETLEQVSQREASLGIFHAVGKVVYNKRDEAPLNDSEPLPDYLAHLSRPKRSQVAVDSLIDEIGTDSSTFISALHENYALSCETTSPGDPNSSIDYINGCLDALSDADLMCPSWDIFFGGRGWSGPFTGRDTGSHVLRQDEMAFHVAVRGMLFALPRPVKRIASGPGRGQDAFKMFYPTSIKLWRSKEEMEALVDLWSTKLLNGEESKQRSITEGANIFLRNQPTNSVLSPSKYNNGNSKLTSFNSSTPLNSARSAQEEHSTPLLSLGSAARRELILERLPYMAHISRARKTAFTSMRSKDIEKVVSFQGINTPGAEDDEASEGIEEGGEGGEAWATDKPAEESPRKRALGIRKGVERLVVEKLCLSDDDIESD